MQDVASRYGNISKYPTKIQLIYVVKRLQDLSMLTPISPLLINQSGEIGHLKLKAFVTQEEGTITMVQELFNEMSQVKTVIMDGNNSGDIVARPEGLLWKATITMSSFLTFLASLVCLSHIFIHEGKKSSENEYPSWVNDLLVFCSFVIATSFCSVATVLLRWGKSVNNIQLLSHKYTESAEMHSMQLKGALEEHEINIGKRPNLIGNVFCLNKRIWTVSKKKKKEQANLDNHCLCLKYYEKNCKCNKIKLLTSPQSLWFTYYVYLKLG